MDKEQTAMERLRLASDMSLRLYHRPLLLTDSGGKDSAVICKLAENAGIPFEIVHSHTTADAPETVYHVRKRAKEYELKGVSYTIHYPTYKGEPTSMWKLIPIKLMPPTLEHIPTLHSRWFRPYIKWLYPFKVKNPYCFCLNCVYAVKAKKKTKYCPDCGAKMDLEESTDA